MPGGSPQQEPKLNSRFESWSCLTWLWPVLPSFKPNSLLPVVFIHPQLLIVYRMALDKIETFVLGTPKSLIWLSLTPSGMLLHKNENESGHSRKSG